MKYFGQSQPFFSVAIEMPPPIPLDHPVKPDDDSVGGESNGKACSEQSDLSINSRYAPLTINSVEGPEDDKSLIFLSLPLKKGEGHTFPPSPLHKGV